MSRTFDDFTPGETIRYGALTLERDALVAFARRFDPQPFHIDEDTAKDTFVGTLIASGWHACALHMRLLADHILNTSTSMGAPGVEEVRWLKPLRPGERLTAQAEVLEARVSRSRPDRGLVRFAFALLDRTGEPVMTQTNWILFGREAPGPAPSLPGTPNEARQPSDAAADPRPHPSIEPAEPTRPFEDVQVGATTDLGTYRFTAADIVAFARDFDPQPFHLSEAGGRASHFGGLVASGWHTAAAWMRTMVDHRERAAAAARAAGLTPARLGPSPGFRDLVWSQPVRPGDTITYRSTIAEKRVSASRPGWGLVFHDNTGENQRGERVFGFRGCVFWERRS